jgi:hypothetical protein
MNDIEFASIIRRVFTIFLLAVSVAATATVISAQDPKLKAEDILAKHIESLGKPEALTAAANRKMEGTATIRNVRVPKATLTGAAFLASAAGKQVTLIAFQASNAGDYTGERVNFDGKKLDIPFITASERSPLGTFIFEYPEISKGYIFSGALFSSWALLDPAKIGKFELQGKEKIDGVETYKIKFVPKGGTTLTIRMFFDTTTFRHVRTEYTRTETAGTVRSDEGRLNENRYKLIEDFSGFSKVNDLMLPTTYKVTYRYETLQRSNEFQWDIKLTRFGFDPAREPEIFAQKVVP